MSGRLVIAVDGPSASGKGTLAKRLAVHFRLPHLDTGLLYRAAKRALLRMNGRAELPVAVRRNLYHAAARAAQRLSPTQGRVSMNVTLGQEAILMPRQLGFERGQQKLSLQLELSLEDALSETAA